MGLVQRQKVLSTEQSLLQKHAFLATQLRTKTVVFQIQPRVLEYAKQKGTVIST